MSKEHNEEYDEDISLLHPGSPPKIKYGGKWIYVEGDDDHVTH